MKTLQTSIMHKSPFVSFHTWGQLHPLPSFPPSHLASTSYHHVLFISNPTILLVILVLIGAPIYKYFGHLLVYIPFLQYTILTLIHIHLPSWSTCLATISFPSLSRHPTFIHQNPLATHPILWVHLTYPLGIPDLWVNLTCPLGEPDPTFGKTLPIVWVNLTFGRTWPLVKPNLTFGWTWLVLWGNLTYPLGELDLWENLIWPLGEPNLTFGWT